MKKIINRSAAKNIKIALKRKRKKLKPNVKRRKTSFIYVKPTEKSLAKNENCNEVKAEKTTNKAKKPTKRTCKKITKFIKTKNSIIISKHKDGDIVVKALRKR